MNEFEALKTIAESLSERKTLAALSNYQVLTNNISYVNTVFKESLTDFSETLKEIEVRLKDDESASPEAKDSACPLLYFRKIVPRIINNGIQICQKFQLSTLPDDRSGITLNNLHLLHRSFADYSDLVTATRQVVDSLLSDAYQMVCLDPKSLNYHVLSSLSSFKRYATESIWHSIAEDELIKLLNEFDALKFHERSRSGLSQCLHDTFAKKLDYVFSQLGISDEKLKNNLKDSFSFSSEFTHIGYVSTMFSDTYDFQCVFGDSIGPYLPSTENFSELKYRLLETAVTMYSRVYLPSIQYALTRLMGGFSDSINKQITLMSGALQEGLRSRNNQYYFFICSALPSTCKNVEIPCRCGETRIWSSPYERDELFCQKCGSSFNLIEMEGDPGYVITSSGPVKVLGSSVPDLKDLPEEELKSLLAKCLEIEKERP